MGPDASGALRVSRNKFMRFVLIHQVLYRVAGGVLSVLIAFVPLQAQTSDSKSIPPAPGVTQADAPWHELTRSTNEYAVWAAGSIESPSIGNTAYRSTALVGLRYGRVVGVKKQIGFEYTFDFVPVEAVFNAETGHFVYGFGVWPGGIKMNFGQRSRVRLFVGANGGVVGYTQAVPTNGRRLNFAVNLDGGMHIFMLRGRALTVSYKYHHVSNAFTAPVNIGTNVNMVTFGLSLFK